MSADPNWTTLVDAAVLAAALQHPQLRLLDARAATDRARPARSAQGVRAGHLPGAYYADLDQDLAALSRPAQGGTRCRTARHSPNVWANGASIRTPRSLSTTRPMAAWRLRARGGCCD